MREEGAHGAHAVESAAAVGGQVPEPAQPAAPTLGDVGCTLSHPASSSHRALTEESRAALGISEGYFRLSVGIEPPELVLAELDDALAAVRGES